MSADGISITIPNAAEIRRRLNELPKRIAKKAVRQAVTKATRPIRMEAKRRAPKRSGALRRAMAQKIKTLKRDEGVLGIIGPQSDYVRAYKDEDGTIALAKPVKYAHLVEFGHAKRGGGTVAAQPFMRPAWRANQDRALRIYGAHLKRAIYAEAAKLDKGH